MDGGRRLVICDVDASEKVGDGALRDVTVDSFRGRATDVGVAVSCVVASDTLLEVRWREE